jgi:type II secretion system protein C
MQKNSKNSLVAHIFKLFVLLFIAKTVMLAVWFFLPQSGVVYFEQKNYQPPFNRYNTTTILETMSSPTSGMQTTQTSASTAMSITNIILKALYGNTSKAMVVVATKSDAKKSEVIGIGELFMGYRLKSVTLDSALFEKDGKEYILKLQKSELKSQPQIAQKRVFTPDVPVEVNKEEIALYAKNPDQIWKDIAITEIKEGTKIKGFQVTRINPNSRFAELGLEKGDVIIKANNILLTSYQDAINIYQNIETLQSIQIVFLRNNQEKELIYEIR